MKIIGVIFLLLLFEKIVVSDEVKKRTSWKKGDENFYDNVVKQIIKDVANGIPHKSIKTLDPLEISNLEYETMQDEIFHFTGLRIVGVKNVDVIYAKFDLELQYAEIQLKLDLIVLATMAIEFTDINKSITNMKYRATTKPITLTTKAGYDISNDDGEKHFVFSTENTTECLFMGDPVVNLDGDLDKVLREDPDLQKRVLEFNQKETRVWKNQIICKIAKVVVAKLMENFRIFMRNFSTSEFVKG